MKNVKIKKRKGKKNILYDGWWFNKNFDHRAKFEEKLSEAMRVASHMATQERRCCDSEDQMELR
jgi:hypothetical protein